MPALNIPVLTDTTIPSTQEVEMDGSVYDLSLRFNARDGKWRLKISLDGVILVTALPLVIGEDILSEKRHVENLPPGNLIIRDLDDLDRDPEGTLFGESVLLLYDDLT